MTIQVFTDEDQNKKFQYKNIEVTFFSWDFNEENQKKIIDFLDFLPVETLDEIVEILPDFQDRTLNVFYTGVPSQTFDYSFGGFKIEEFYNFIASNNSL